MSTEGELLRAVLSDPQSDEPRWNFAGWAEQHGDPRAKLIGWQMTVAEFQRSHSPPSKWFKFSREASKLVEQYGTLWTESLAPLVDDKLISDLRFHRGFVEHVAMRAEHFPIHAPRVFALAPIRHLTLVDLPANPAALDDPSLGRMVSLAITGAQIADDEIERLATSEHARRIRWLDLLGHHVTLRGVEAVCAAPYMRSLQYVNLKANRIDDPVERFWHEGETITHTSETDLGRDLERRFGPQAWLHAPSKFGDAYPPLYEATVDP